MKLNIHIDSDNDALADPDRGREVARILHKLADKFERYPRDLFEVKDGVLFDINGASVGTWSVEASPADHPYDDCVGAGWCDRPMEAHDSR